MGVRYRTEGPSPFDAVEPPEPPIPPKPEGDDWVAIDRDDDLWTPFDIKFKGWEEVWREYGPLTVYRPEVRG